MSDALASDDALTAEQRDFLNESLEYCTLRPASGYRILFGSDNARPMILELMDAGILEPYDVMKERPSGGETISVFGKTVPLMTLVGSYRLTDAGQHALSRALDAQRRG